MFQVDMHTTFKKHYIMFYQNFTKNCGFGIAYYTNLAEYT